MSEKKEKSKGFLARIRGRGERIRREIQAFHEKGLFAAAHERGSPSKTIRAPNVKSYFNWYKIDGAVHSGVDYLAETSVGLGFFHKMPESYKYELDDKGELVEPEEIKVVNRWNKYWNMDALYPNIAKVTILGGYCPVETKITSKYPSKNVLKIIHPQTVDKITKENGELKSITEKGNNKPILAKNLNWFVHGQIANDIRGMSLIESIETLLDAKSNAINNMDEIIKRYLAPTIIWKSAGDIDPIKEAVGGWKPGEDIYLGQLDPEDLEFTAQVLEVDGRAKFWEFIGYIDELLWIGMNTANQKYWRNATQASATKLDDIVGRRIGAIQRPIKRGGEQGFYTNVLKVNRFKPTDENDIIPRINWGKEPTGVEDVQIAEFLRAGVDSYYIEKPVYFEILKLLGLDIDWKEEEEKEPEDDGVPPPNGDDDGDQET